MALLCCLLAIPSMGFAKVYYGALAIDDTRGITGGVINKNTSEQAEKGALQDCKKEGGKKCEIAVTFYDSCAALAWSKQTKVAKRGWAESSLQGAENEALNRCNAASKIKDCKIMINACTSWDYYYYDY